MRYRVDNLWLQNWLWLYLKNLNKKTKNTAKEKVWWVIFEHWIFAPRFALSRQILIQNVAKINRGLHRQPLLNNASVHPSLSVLLLTGSKTRRAHILCCALMAKKKNLIYYTCETTKRTKNKKFNTPLNTTNGRTDYWNQVTQTGEMDAEVNTTNEFINHSCSSH